MVGTLHKPSISIRLSRALRDYQEFTMQEDHPTVTTSTSRHSSLESYPDPIAQPFWGSKFPFAPGGLRLPINTHTSGPLRLIVFSFEHHAEEDVDLAILFSPVFSKLEE